MLRLTTASTILLALALTGAGEVAAQDVEMLGRRYGTPLPDGYRQLREARPDAFRFSRGRALRGREIAAGSRSRALRIQGSDDGAGLLSSTLGPRDQPVEGEFNLPVLMGLFGDTPGSGPHSAAQVEEAYFSQGPETIRAYYQEVSGGRLDIRGDVRGWYRAEPSRTRSWVTDGQSGLGGGGRVGHFIKDLVIAADQEGVEWGIYDNDGPDGVPNSGDDDGFVDALAVLHPTRGGECGGAGSEDRIWSHRWGLAVTTGRAYSTRSPAAGGGFIQVDDYLIQPVESCTRGLNEIGIFTHELGHAFGLPDLYDTVGADGRHQGAGTWDLMATGSWGCDDASPDRPCHMGAWSRVQLGWAEVVDVEAGTPLQSVVLPPVETSGVVYRVASADGSRDYFLLENRQRLGFDATLPGEGLLIWQIDPDRVDFGWQFNVVNASPQRGVWLRQADGLDDLGQAEQGRGDAGDPFPLEEAGRVNRVFHAGSAPASSPVDGSATGVTLLDIRRQGRDIGLDLLTRRFTVTIQAEVDDASGGVFSVDGISVSGASHSFASAPFQEHVVEAAAGRTLGPGIRRPFDAWADGPLEPRVRTLITGMEDATYRATYAGEQVELDVEVRGEVDGISPVELVSVPYSEDLWFEPGTELSLEARAEQGFAFAGWTGALEGQGNPAFLTLDQPMQAGADFNLVYRALSASATVEAAQELSLTLEADNATPPVRWTVLEGPLPGGLRLDPGGSIDGVPLQLGVFPLRLMAEDARGLRAEAEVSVTVDEPTLGLDELASTFLLVGPPLTAPQERFLDLQGNDNGSYDLGDFRSWVLAHPTLPMTSPARAPSAAGPLLRIRVGPSPGGTP